MPLVFKASVIQMSSNQTVLVDFRLSKVRLKLKFNMTS